MKTGRLPLILGIILVILQVILVLFCAIRFGNVLVWARGGFRNTILFCLPAIVGLSLISMGLRRRKEIEALMRDPNRPDPWER